LQVSATGDSFAARNERQRESRARLDGIAAAVGFGYVVTEDHERRNKMIAHGSNGSAWLLAGVMVLGASMAGCVAADTDQAAAGNDDTSAADQRAAEDALADVGDQLIDPGSNATSESPIYVRFWYPGGRNWTFECFPGYQHSTGYGGTNTWPTEATNNCGHRTWLYQNSNFTGATLCLSPFSHTGTLHSAWRAFRTVSSTAPCN
jgi:hypothetical protein